MKLRHLRETESWQWPEGTGDDLLRILRDRQAEASDRLLAAELAGDFTVIGDDLIGALLSIALSGDEEEELRCSAAISLGPALEHMEMSGFEDEDEMISRKLFDEICRSLPKLYADRDVPDEVRRRVLEASVRAPQEWHSKAVREAYQDEESKWRLTAVFCMQYVRGFEPEILEALGSEDTEVRYHAACAAGAWEVDEAWDDIVSIVRAGNADKMLRLAAIEALGSIRPEECGEVLGDFLEDDDEDIAEAAMEALSMAEARMEFSDGFDDDEDE